MGEKRSRKSESRRAEITVKSKPEVVNSALGSFPGVLPESGLEFNVYQSKDSRHAGRQIVRGQNAQVSFSAATFGEAGAGPQFGKYLLGVYNPVTQKVTLQETPVLSFTQEVLALRDLPSLTEDTENAYESRSVLGKEFGGKFMRSQITNREKNKVDYDDMASENPAVLSQIAMQDEGTQAATDSIQQRNRRHLPPHNTTTDELEEVYPLAGVVPSYLQKQLPVDTYLAQREQGHAVGDSITIKSTYVQKRLDQHLKGNAHPDMSRVGLLILLDYLISLAQLHPRETTKQNILSETLNNPPMAVLDYIRDQFTEAKSIASGRMVRTMTNASTEKLQCYVVVIALLSNGFHFIVDDLATELRIPTVKLGQICKSTGCQVIVTTAARDVDADTTKKGKTSSVRKAILTAPIEFPKERQLPKRARQ